MNETHIRGAVLETGRLNSPTQSKQVYFVAPNGVPGYSTVCPAGSRSTVLYAPINPETHKEEIRSEFEDLGWMATGTNTGLSGEVLAATFRDPDATLVAAGFRVVDQTEFDKLVKEIADAKAKVDEEARAEQTKANEEVAAVAAKKREAAVANVRKAYPEVADDLLFLLGISA